MNIVIIGATGGVGRKLMQFALDEGHIVTAAVRNPSDLIETHPNLRVVACDVRDEKAVERAVAGQDVVYCTLGDPSRGPTTLYSAGAAAVAAACRTQAVRRIVFLSNFGAAGEKAVCLPTFVLLGLVRAFLRHTLADHALALDVLRDQPTPWIAVRPMAMTDGRYSAVYRIAREGLPRGGSKISRADVADFMLRQATCDDYLNSAPAIAY